jgi:hypothetical protein
MDSNTLYEMPVSKIDVNDIDTAAGPYTMSYGFDIEPLAVSIRRVGLLHPIILRRRGEGNPKSPYQVVCGFRRINALKSLNLKQAPCRVLSESITPFECLEMNLFDNLTTRSFNTVERAMILRRLAHMLPQDRVVSEFMPLLGLPSHPETLTLYLRIDENLNNDAKDLMVMENLSLQAASMVLDMDRASRSAFCAFFKEASFSKNQQIQVIDMVQDLSIMKNVSMSHVLKSSDMDAIMEDVKMNRPQKTKAIMGLLRKKRNPKFSEAENRFRRMVSRLGLPSGVHLNAPPFFEAPGYTLQIQFLDGKDLTEKLETLIRVDGLSRFSNPWSA